MIRSLLVPAIMHRIGPANWAMPAWLDRIVHNLSIETRTPLGHRLGAAVSCIDDR